MPKQTFYGTKLLRVFRRYKTGGPSCSLHPGCPADSMDVIFRAMRQIEVDHMTDIGHVDAPCGNVGRNEHSKGSALKPIQSASSLGQAAVAVKDRNPMSGTA